MFAVQPIYEVRVTKKSLIKAFASVLLSLLRFTIDLIDFGFRNYVDATCKSVGILSAYPCLTMLKKVIPYYKL